ncbi:MAG TPA: metalloregulator ArsR/SmtB family transcription factor [Bryobacteraceae bacterium]|jgi:ArsR family transcriptional regulator
MASILKWLRLLSDPARVRILLLLEKEELSVAELQAILSMAQSSLSTHLAQLKQAGLVEDRRNGKNILYHLKEQRGGERAVVDHLRQVFRNAMDEIPEAASDQDSMRLALKKREDKMRAYFDGLAGRFGREYLPGRSWQGLAETLLKLLPPMVIADLGAGEGTFSQLLAQRAKQVIAVDNSEKMVEFGRDLAARHGVTNLDYRVGDLESPPIDAESVDLAFFSQSLHHAPHPQKAVDAARRILKPGGRIVILDLVRHNFEEARELYADRWLGFAEVEIDEYLRKAGFRNIEISIVHKEEQAPFLETLLGLGEK